MVLISRPAGNTNAQPLHERGEFGRTVYSQGALTPTNYGRDHVHGRVVNEVLA